MVTIPKRLNEKEKENISQAYRKLYRAGGALLENAKALAYEDGLDENVKAMIKSITQSSEHRFGRYRELSRKH